MDSNDDNDNNSYQQEQQQLQTMASSTIPRPTITPPPPPKIPAAAAAAEKAATKPKKDNSRRLDKNEKNVLLHLLQAPKLTNNDIARIIDVDERTVSRRRKQLRTLGHLSPERNSKGAEKLRPWHLARVVALLEADNDLQLKDCQDFLRREFDLHVTLSTISRQLKRANHARATRPGYKATRPDLQGDEQDREQPQQLQPQQQQQQQQQQQEGLAPQGELQPLQQQAESTSPSQEPQQLTPWGRARLLAQDAARGVVPLAGPQPQDNGMGPAVKLACPFYRYDPQRYANAPFCRGQWPTARDVKEHIYRQHMVPKFRCNRCMDNFPDEDGLIAHQRALEPCNLHEWEPLDGCTEEQKNKIRKGDKGDEVNRWNRMFRILFPEVDEEALPSALADEEAPYFSVAAVDPGLQQWEAEVPEEDADVE